MSKQYEEFILYKNKISVHVSLLFYGCPDVNYPDELSPQPVLYHEIFIKYAIFKSKYE